jgi:hypothetical protein
MKIKKLFKKIIKILKKSPLQLISQVFVIFKILKYLRAMNADLFSNIKFKYFFGGILRKKLLFFLIPVPFIVIYSLYGTNFGDTPPSYVGSQACVCHPQILQTWVLTGHAQIQQTPGPGTVTAGNWNSTINMGAAYGNATVTLSIVGGVYKMTLNPSSGSPVTYDVAYTMGYNWRQYYLFKLGNSYYRGPIEWEYEAYQEPQTGSFAPQSPASFFNANGTLKSLATNTFRKTAWDRSCARCHTTGGQVVRTISGTDSSWTINLPTIDTINAKVGCEGCHGPGSNHIAGPSSSNIFGPTRMNQAGVSREQEVCGQCHFRGSSTNMTYGFPWKESVDSCYQVGTPLANYIDPNWIGNSNLTGGQVTWPDTVTKRSYRQQWNEMQRSGHKHAQFLKCWDCHDQHALTGFEHQLKRDPDNNDLCLGCHMNFGTPGNPNVPAITAHTKHFYDPTNTNQTGGSSRCTKCHVATTGMQWNTVNYDNHSHTFWAIPPIKTLQKLSVTTPTLGMLNSCAVSCHRNPATASGTGNVPNLGVGFDSTVTNWRQPTDSALADTLNRWFSRQSWSLIGINPVSNEIPNKFILGQNYPNPFNPNTEINFAVPKSEFVTIRIYDIMGREVYTLVNERLNPGNYRVNWQSINSYGDDVASGVYFYKMNAGNYIESKKMILVR